MTKLIEILLLCALPASGKSETRKYLETRTPEECTNNFHFGKTVQLDDYPYVHLARCVDESMKKRNQSFVFFEAGDKCFKDGRDWGMLIELLNEDYDDLVKVNRKMPQNPSKWLLDRYDRAKKVVGAPEVFSKLAPAVRKNLEEDILAEATKLAKDKIAGVPDTLKDSTIVVEFARGGSEKMTPPIPAPFGYEYSLTKFSPEILKKAAMLYIWVTPEQSRAKNQARCDPNNPGSILNHGVPEFVMRNDYGCDDINYLLSVSDKKNTLKVKHEKGTFYIACGILDNHQYDYTTFARGKVESWKKEDVEKLRAQMQKAMDAIAETYFSQSK